MREHPWLVPVLAWLLAITSSQNALAQYPPEANGYLPQVPSFPASGPAYGYQRTPFSNIGNSNAGYPVPISMQQPAPGLAPQDAAGTTSLADTMMPFPAISAFMPSFTQHKNEGGLWFSRKRNYNRKYFMQIDYLYTKTRKPHGAVGNESAPSYLRTLEATQNIPIIDVFLAFDDADPIVFTQFEGQIPPDRSVADNPVTSGGANLFNQVDASVIGHINGHGIRSKFGYVNDDGGGMVFTAWWNTKSKGVFDAKRDLARQRDTEAELFAALLDEITFTGNETDGPIGRELSDLQMLEPLLQNNVHNLRGLPLDDGTLQVFDNGQSAIGGVTAPYDLQFVLTMETESGGGSLSMFSAPLAKWGPISFRPIGGIRYQYIREDFNFFGQDSGLVYIPDMDGPIVGDIKAHSIANLVDDDMDGIVDNAGIIEVNPLLGMGGGQMGATTPLIDISRLQLFPTLYPITAFVDSKARSHLAGPEIGVQYGIDGNRFRLEGQTTFGVMANYERLTLNGDNIGMTTRPGNFIQPTTQNITPNSFNDIETHTHVSPMLETSLTVSAQLLQYVPVLRRIEALSAANFRFGYSFLFVGAVVAPEDSILWQGNPAIGLFPDINLERQDWTMSAWNFGLEWIY